MLTVSKRWTALAAAALIAAGLAACENSSSSGTSSSSGKPVHGGTLRMIADGGPDHLDPVAGYYSPDYILEHTYTRQLVSYQTPTTPLTSTSGPAWVKA